MKITDVPAVAWDTAPTPLPTKQVYDWEALYQTLKEKHFLIIESDNVRGLYDCVEVKLFNNYLRKRNIPLFTKRLSKNRWFCTL